MNKKILLALPAVLAIFNLLAQPLANKPNTLTQVPAPSQPVFTTPAAYPAGILINYVRTREALGAITDLTTFNSAAYTDVKESTQYFDGLGRLLQTVNRQASPNAHDMVNPVLYDEFGREVHKYLPYVQTTDSSTSDGKFKISPFAAQATFFQNTALNPDLVGEQVFYSQTEFESSPLDRITKEMKAGNSWAGNLKGVRTDYLFNTSASDAVRIWTISNDPFVCTGNDVTTNIPATTAVYDDGQLYKNVTTDENSNVVVEYKDKDGQLILKKVQSGTIASDYSGYTGFLCTYYVYDDLNELRFVMPPKAVAYLLQNGWSFSADVINELCFRYEYDAKKRMIAKKTPGVGWEYMIYDPRDLVVYKQDANMRLNNQWILTEFDILDRNIYVGMITYSGCREDLQSNVDVFTSLTNTQRLDTIPFPADLYVNQRVPGLTQYAAQQTITFTGEFTSESGAEFTTLLDDVNGGSVQKFSYPGDPVPYGSVLVGLILTHYDDYSWTTNTYSTANNSKLSAGNNLHPVALPTQANGQTIGMVTGKHVRVIEDPSNISEGSMLATVNFYDNRGRIIQSQAENYKGGLDISTNLYDFTGKILSNYMLHNNPASLVPGNTTIRTDRDYDHTGRDLKTSKVINDNTTEVTISSRSYYERGLINQEKIGQKKNTDNTTYTTDPLETLNYSYNILGWAQGINKDYANNISNTNWFGMQINYDWGFANTQCNGNVSGVKWRSKGDGERRAYGFSYDMLNRFMGADFAQYDGSAYVDNSIVNFDVEMGNGQAASSAYDENGNIKAMKQWGLKINTGGLVDDLGYNYTANSNKLLNVIDAQNDPNTTLGDFRTSTFHPVQNKTNTTVDYTYDNNGNLKKDLNKDIGTASVDGIQYNHLNFPYKITVNSGTPVKGTITYIYNAEGNKLEKRVHDNTNSQQPDKTTTYIGSFEYENNQLQFYTHDEGRIRINTLTPTNFDYFLKDLQGDVRMTLTDEQQTDVYQAGMETANRDFETALFGNKIGSTATTKPGGFDNDGNNAQVSRVNGTTEEGRVGPGVILKVMSGDKIMANTYAWYQPTNTDLSTDNTLQSIVLNLLGQLVPGVNFEGKGTVAQGVTGDLLQPGMTSFIGEHTPLTDRPKAYLNWILLDEEQFKLVDASSGYAQVPLITGTTQKQLVQANSGSPIEMTKNGYLYLYVSNESKDDVYFDDIHVEHIHGPLLEETHYYPFGLTMAGISSKAFGKLENKKNKFQGQEYNNDFDVDMYEFKYRMDDPQTGRFWQVDPLSDKYVYNSTYAFSEDKVTSHVELEGLENLSTALKNTFSFMGYNPQTMDNQAQATVNNVVEKAKPYVETTIKVAEYGVKYGGIVAMIATMGPVGIVLGVGALGLTLTKDIGLAVQPNNKDLQKLSPNLLGAYGQVADKTYEKISGKKTTVGQETGDLLQLFITLRSAFKKSPNTLLESKSLENVHKVSAGKETYEKIMEFFGGGSENKKEKHHITKANGSKD